MLRKFHGWLWSTEFNIYLIIAFIFFFGVLIGYGCGKVF
jgi:hypothetical protein